MVTIEPIRVELEREEDGRFLASVPELPGVMAYGDTEAAAVQKVKSIALQVLADMIENGEPVPEPLGALLSPTNRATLDLALKELAQFSHKIPFVSDEAFSRESLYPVQD